MAAKKWTAWTIRHGRWIFTDYVRAKKQHAIYAYVQHADDGWTWKKLYASGARAVRVSLRELKP